MNLVPAYELIALMVALLAPVAIAVWVVSDAGAIRRLEVLSCGESDCRPHRWAIAVVLLPIVAIPLYMRFRRSRTRELERVGAAASLAD